MEALWWPWLFAIYISRQTSHTQKHQNNTHAHTTHAHRLYANTHTHLHISHIHTYIYHNHNWHIHACDSVGNGNTGTISPAEWAISATGIQERWGTLLSDSISIHPEWPQMGLLVYPGSFMCSVIHAVVYVCYSIVRHYTILITS